MTIQDIFVLAKKNNVQLWLDGGQLRYRAPQESLSGELLELLRQQRDAVVRALRTASRSGAALFPLSYNQQSLWVLHQMRPKSSAYTVAAACRVLSAVQGQAVVAALRTLLERHEALRTTYDFWPSGSTPCQYIHAETEPCFKRIDARGSSDAELRESITACLQEPFDLAAGPVMRTHLFSRDDREHVLLFAIHHIACDAASLGIYIDEFLRAYAAHAAGSPALLPKTTFDYRDYIVSQHELLSGDRGGQLLSYWKQALAGMPDELALPADLPYPAVQGLSGASVFFDIGGDRYRAVIQEARTAGITVSAFLLACFELMLMRVSRQTDLAVAVAASGRTRSAHARVCGYCVNPVVVRCKTDRALGRQDFLRAAAAGLLEALEHQDYPFSLLVEKLAPRRHAGRQPLAQVLFNFINRQGLGAAAAFVCPAAEPVQAGPLRLLPYVVAQQEGQYELALDLIDGGDGLSCALKYSTDIFTPAAGEALARQYQETVLQCCGSPELVIDPVLLKRADAASGKTPAEPAAGPPPVRERADSGMPVLDLPADRPRSAGQGYLAGCEQILLEAGLVKKIRALSRQNRCGWFAATLAAYCVLLYRLTAQKDLLIGIRGLGRPDADMPDQFRPGAPVGGLRISVDEEQPFNLFMQLIHAALAASSQEGGPRPAMMEPGPVRAVFTPGAPPAADTQSGEVFDLDMSAAAAGGGLVAQCRFNARLFDPATIRVWLAAYRLMLEDAACRPWHKLWELPVAGPELKAKMLKEWNDTDRQFSPAQNLAALLDRQVARTPWAQALRMGGHTLSYTELGLRAAALAEKLRQRGVGPDTPVGICSHRSLGMVAGIIAVVKAGGAYVPLEPELPIKRIAAMLRDCKPAVVLAQSACRGSLPEDCGCPVLLLDEHLPDQAPSSCRIARPGKDNLAYVMFTSGSTGTPKGVMNTQGGICNRLLWMQQEFPLTEKDRVLQKTPFGFDVSVWEFFWPLITGASLVISPPGAHRDPVQLKQIIEAEKITIMHFVPSMLRLFLEDQTAADLSSLRHVIASGEALPAELQRLFFRRMPGSAQLHNLYGPTEAAVDVTCWHCRRDDDRSFVPIGRPIANTRIYILDGKLQPVLPGVAGELYIGGAGLARGYINNPGLTDEKFIRHPFSPSARQRLYRTGDRARFLPDGSIDCLGRLDGQVKLGGCRVEPGELEAVLLQHPLVSGAAVTAHAFSEHDTRLCAYVTLHAGSVPAESVHETLQAFLRAQVPDYMIPSSFTVLDSLPLTASGKVDRKGLPRPLMARSLPSVDFVGARSELEHSLVALWMRHVQIDCVGIKDNFFDLGGTSLLLTRIAAEFNAATGFNVQLTDLFAYPTIASLAEHITRTQAGSEQVAATGDRAKKTKAALAHKKRHEAGESPRKAPEREQQHSGDTGLLCASLPAAATAAGLFEAQAAKNPDAEAAACGGARVTYGELEYRANQLGRFLRRLGLGPEKLAGIYLERSLDMLVAVLAVMKAGGAYVPLDAAFPRDRLEFMMRDAGLQVLITQESLAGDFPGICPAAMAVCDAQREEISREPGESLGGVARGDNLAYVIYTSGSTGKPKGVEIEQRALVNFLASMQIEPGFGPQDALLALTTLSFDIAGLELLLPLAAGGRLVIAEREAALDGRLLQQRLRESGATVLQATPVTWRMLLEAGWRQNGQPLKALCGGEALTRELADRIMAAGAELWNMYGPTETTIWSMVGRVAPGPGAPDLGRAIARTQLRVLDEKMQAVAAGEIGELYIGGAGLARGYRGLPELTQQRFVDHLPAGGRLYRTGDLVRRHADGLFEFLGRSDQQVKLRGFRIELGEIEAVLGRHAAVAGAAAAVRKDGRGEDRIVGYVVLRPGAAAGAQELREFLQALVPDYMIPDFFMFLDALSQTPNGKIDRKALPTPDMTRPVSATAYVAPRSRAESQIAGVWKRVLDVAQIGVNDNFFDLGGNSLLLVQACRELERELGREIAPNMLFQYPTVACLAACFDAPPEQPELAQQAAARARRQRAAGKMQQRLKHNMRVQP